MLIDFNNICEKIFNNYRNGQKDTTLKIFSDNQVRIMLGKLESGASIGLHTHEDNSEVVFILQGQCIEFINGIEEHLKLGMCHYCPKGSSHTLINDGDDELIFYAMVY